MRIKLEAHAFVIWRYCERHGWDQLQHEIADGTGLTVPMVRDVIVRKGWSGRIGGESVSAARYRGRQKSGAILHKRMGHDFDESVLDLVDLFA